jgi:hypothetical protein
VKVRLTRFALLLALTACTEHATAPGVCPDFCPGGQIGVVDTIFTDMIERDTAFSGYVEATGGEVMVVADVPGAVDSRAIFRMNAMPTSIVIHDSTTSPIIVDSARLQIEILHRDTNATNLWIKLYRLPLDIDTTTTFAQVIPAFTDSIVDSVSLNTLLSAPLINDTATVRIWTVPIRTDSAGHILRVIGPDSTLFLDTYLDTAQARFVAADSGRVAFGVRVSPDSANTIALGTSDIGRGARLTWFYNYLDSTATVKYDSLSRGPIFDSFVFNPPTPPIDSNLAIGGVPAARSLLRVKIPRLLRDSADVVRATLIMVPVGPVPGAPADSFTILARPVIADLGAKSPLSTNSPFFGTKVIHLNVADTLRMELTDLVRSWALDSTLASALMLGQAPEGASYAQIRFYSTRSPAFQPTLHITFVRRYAFGVP